MKVLSELIAAIGAGLPPGALPIHCLSDLNSVEP